MNSTHKPENLRDRIQSGYLYSVSSPDGFTSFLGSTSARKYYDQLMEEGSTAENAIAVISQYRKDGLVQLTDLIPTHIKEY